jgi:hypothetical protein
MRALQIEVKSEGLAVSLGGILRQSVCNARITNRLAECGIIPDP